MRFLSRVDSLHLYTASLFKLIVGHRKTLMCYNINMNKKTLTILIVVILIFGGALGFLFGMQTGKQSADENLENVVGLIFPKPAEEIFALTGKLLAVNGSTLSIEIRDPDDYLPHVDGSEPAKETRYASLMTDTKITLINIGKLDATGNPEMTSLKADELTIGETITVRSDTNIKDEKKFDVKEVEVVKY